MAKKQKDTAQNRKAQEYEQLGLEAYDEWNIDHAIECFGKASELVPDEPAYVLQLARALARGGNFDRALKALAEFIRLEGERTTVLLDAVGPACVKYFAAFSPGLPAAWMTWRPCSPTGWRRRARPWS